jgi:hypothetical protein
MVAAVASQVAAENMEEDLRPDNRRVAVAEKARSLKCLEPGLS